MRALHFLTIILFFTAVVRATEEAAELARSGRHAEAARLYLMEANEAVEPVVKIKATLNAASCMKLSGDVSAATRLLAEASPLLDQIPGDRVKALFFSEYGAVLAMGRQPRLAPPVLERAAALAVALDDPALLAEIRNDMGIARASAGLQAEAHADFHAAMELARASGSGDLLARARQNRLIASFALWKEEHDALRQDMEIRPFAANGSALKSARSRFESDLAETAADARMGMANPTRVFGQISAGLAAVRYGFEEQGFGLLRSALETARGAGWGELECAALLALTELYVDHGRREDAMILLGGLRDMDASSSPEQRVTLAVLRGRCEMLPGGDPAKAMELVDAAISTIQDLRGDLATSQSISDLNRPFREAVGLPYLLKADLETRDGSPAALDRARNAIESYKAWELDDFYRDDCVDLALETSRDLSRSLSEGVAVIYLIPLQERTEILVGTSSGLKRWTSAIGREVITTQAKMLRHQLEFERGIPSYIEPAELLYQKLISPCLDHLRASGVRHLVFVPEGDLASIPPGVLRDPASGRFLIEEFSLSISPGLSIRPSDAESTGGHAVLLAGVSDAVQGFVPLPGVKPELEGISRIHDGAKVLLNGAFSQASLRAGLIESQATLIHIASHAEFTGDPMGTFLLAYDEKVTMDDLEQMIRPRKFTGMPVELLCLSACRTAAGDERAALGLAGVAIKSGARSVVASLWYIDDASSSGLMTGFHRNLQKPGATKAEALRKTQLDMIASDPYIHPYLWAPFILIGDW